MRFTTWLLEEMKCESTTCGEADLTIFKTLFFKLVVFERYLL